MKKINFLSKILILVLTLSLVLSAFAACKGKEENQETPNEGLLDLTDFKIIRADFPRPQMVNEVVNMKNKIKDVIGPDLPVCIDIDTPESEKEILIGNTDRAASKATLDMLKAQTSEDAYIINITDTKIVINGTTEQAVRRAVKIFMYKYVNVSSSGTSLNISAGPVLAELYDASALWVEFENGVEVDLVQAATTLIQAQNAPTKDPVLGYLTQITQVHYPRIVELQHQPNEEDNGKLIAHFRLAETLSSTNACFMESSDGGQTWSILSRPKEQKSGSLVPGQMAHIYELPAQLGDFPAGTLVYSSGSIDYSVRSEIWNWYSTDCGKTWTQTSLIAVGGVIEPNDDWERQSGVWEPFTWYEDGWLYCFYSDDSDPRHDQKLVYKRSQDGINWSDIVDVCKFDNSTERPGMFIMTKMGNGEYLMVYEYINAPGGHKNFYKKTKDITSWNPSDPGKAIQTADGYYGISAPSCLWIPAGGECGTLIATGTGDTDGSHRIFVSFDYGETWTTMKNPFTYNKKNDATEAGRIGYSPSFVLGADGHTVYALCTTDVPETGRYRIQFVSFKIY